MPFFILLTTCRRPTLCGISRRDDAIQNRANACSTLSCANCTFSQPRCALAERAPDIDELGGLLHDQRNWQMRKKQAKQQFPKPAQAVITWLLHLRSGRTPGVREGQRCHHGGHGRASAGTCVSSEAWHVPQIVVWRGDRSRLDAVLVSDRLARCCAAGL